MNSKLIAILGTAALMMSVASAHHSFSAEFDVKKPLTLKGTLVKWEMINPHSWFHIEVKDPNGSVIEWMIEGGSPNSLIRQGVTKNTIQIEQIEHQLEVPVQHEVIEEDRNVEGAARQSDVAVGVARVGHIFVAGVAGIEQEVGAEHALVDVLRGEIDMMVMIP